MKRTVLFAKETRINNGNGFYPEDIRRIYNIPSEFDGSGESIGILEFSNGYSLNDAHQFWKLHGIPSPKVAFVSVDGTRNDGGTSPDDEEASLDLQWAGAIAPKASIIIYEANGGTTYTSFGDALVRTLEYVLNDSTHKPSVLSISYGDAEENFDEQTMHRLAAVIQSLNQRGVTVCVASGDQGAYGMHDPNGTPVRHADFPASVPLAIAVGGTSLQPSGEETAWTYETPNNGGATGGGFSAVFAAPAYQSIPHASGRGIPDISFNADPATGYQIIFQGQTAVVGGTSVSCPVFAAIIALTNQARRAQGIPPLQNLAQTLYQASTTLPYRDITVGNNSFNGVTGYQAQAGWDACTGWGSLDAAQFIAFMTTQSTSAPTAPGASSAISHTTVTSRADSNHKVSEPSEPGLPSSQGILVRLRATIATVEPDVVIHGVYHHHLLVSNIHVDDIEGADPSVVQSAAFVAIRYGDSQGLPGPIPNLKEGNAIELQGRYIPRNQTYPSVGNPGDAVIHFTHHPIGYVVYEGHRYS